MHTHRNYLVIVSPPIVPSASSASATVRNFATRTNYAATTDITKVAVFDLENKHVAFSGTFNEGVREVISMFDKVYVLSNDGVVCFSVVSVGLAWLMGSSCLAWRRSR